VTDAFNELRALLEPGIAECRERQVPYVVAITGSVAVGKSTTAEQLRDALAAPPGLAQGEVVSSDGFLFPNRVLDAEGLSMRKGFPESYDRAALREFLHALKSGEPGLQVPVYSHEEYDVLSERQALAPSDVVVLEGLHLVHLSESIDFVLYIDADERDIVRWFVERFVALRSTHAFYQQFASLSDEEAAAFARQVWDSINGVNLHECILPTREDADAVLEKGPDHVVRRLRVLRGRMPS
jgi:type I pantothenate kinase